MTYSGMEEVRNDNGSMLCVPVIREFFPGHCGVTFQKTLIHSVDVHFVAGLVRKADRCGAFNLWCSKITKTKMVCSYIDFSITPLLPSLELTDSLLAKAG